MKNGRPRKIEREDVFDILADGMWHKTCAIAGELEVCKATIRGRVNELLDEGFMILNGPGGIKLIDKDDVDEDSTNEILTTIGWMFAIVGAMARRAIPAKKFLPLVRKNLPKTREEKQYLRGLMVRVTHLIDWDSIDDFEE